MTSFISCTADVADSYSYAIICKSHGVVIDVNPCRTYLLLCPVLLGARIESDTPDWGFLSGSPILRVVAAGTSLSCLGCTTEARIGLSDAFVYACVFLMMSLCTRDVTRCLLGAVILSVQGSTWIWKVDKAVSRNENRNRPIGEA